MKLAEGANDTVRHTENQLLTNEKQGVIIRQPKKEKGEYIEVKLVHSGERGGRMDYAVDKLEEWVINQIAR